MTQKELYTAFLISLIVVGLLGVMELITELGARYIRPKGEAS